MKAVQRQSSISRLIAWVTVLSLVINAILPAASLLAQDEPLPTETPALPGETPTVELPTEAPAEPTVEPATEMPTDAPVNPTEEPATEMPTDAPVDPTEEPVTPAPTVTENPTATPSAPPEGVLFLDDFQDGDTAGWLLSPGWQLASEGDNSFLMGTAAGETAVVEGLALGDLTLAVRVRVAPGGQAVVVLRAGEAGRYALTLDANGSATLWRHDTVLAQGPAMPELPADALPPWRTVNVQAVGGALTVSVDGVPVIVVEDVEPLPPGWSALETGVDSAGAVSFDQIVIQMPDAAALPTALPPEPPITSEPPAPSPVVTDEPTASPAPTEPPASEPEEALVLSADFEGEPTGWLLSADASIVVEAGGNHALLLPPGGSLLPAATLVLGDFRLEARLMLLADGGLNLPFRTLDGRGYALSLSAEQTALLRNDGEGAVPIASLPAARELNNWQTLALEARGGALVVSVNGVPELAVEEMEALAAGQLALLAGGTLMLDDVRVFDLTPAAVLAAASPTPAPFTLSEAEIARLPGGMDAILNRYLSGDEAGALGLARAYFLPLDDENRVLVTIWADDSADGATLAALVTQVGGAADYTYDTSVEARLPLAAFLPLANAPQVAGMRFAALATSTSSAGAPAGEGIATYSGTYPTEGYDILGVNDWHLAGFTGGGTNIAVIDTGFADIATIPAAELPTTCLPSRTVNNAPGLSGVGASNHGTKVAQVLCDLAPNARMTLYRATTASQLANRVSTANSAGNHIILITMDLGANVSPGDGTGGSNPDAVSLYTSIQTARNAGRLVIVSAGNNFGRYVSFTYGGGTTSIPITAQPGDLVNVSWNDWDATPNVDLTMSLTGALPYGGRGSGTPSHQFIVVTADPTLSITGVTGAASVYVQVQVTGAGAVGTPTGGTISNLNTSSSLGRPADSAAALTVGAVCARQAIVPASPPDTLTYPILEDSSRGPIFSAGGGAPSAGPFANRTAFKPDLVGPSNVTTTYAVADPDSCASDGTVFSGTSAAAANVAAMAALIRSNTTAFLNPYTGTPQAIINYMQTHSLDLYLGSLPDGYDMAHGAGLAMLGSPRPEAALTAAAADVNPVCRYVNPYSANPDFAAPTYGTFLNPFVHVAPAINAAGNGGCVILFPGEYVSGISITSALPSQVRVQSYDSAANGGRLSASTPDSIFWVNNTHKSIAGITVQGNNPVIDGLVFRSANPLQPGALDVQFSRPVAMTVYDSSLNPGAAIRNSVFTGFRGNPPVIIGDNAENVTVENNTFSSNDNRGGAALKIVESTDIRVQRNTFTGNNSTGLGADISEPVVQISDSVASLYNNRFVGNGARSVLRVRNAGDPVGEGAGANEIQVFGNLFQDNTGTGPLIHLRPSRRFYFVNNTVVGNTGMDDAVYGLIIARGDSDGSNGDGGWEIHNNLFYNNSPSAGIISDIAITTTCKRIDVPASNNGAQYNWYAFSGSISGDCQDSLGPTVNGNVTVDPKPITDPNSQFVGAAVSPTDPYQLKGTSTAGVDAGSQSLLTAAMLASGDLLGRPRLENGQIDIGAYEFVTVRGQDGDLNFTEDALSVIYNLGVTGGFPPYNYQIVTPPSIYDVNPDNLCGGQPLKVNATTGQVTYCPPKNYYTVGAPAAAQASFTYQVVDAGGNVSPAPSTITLRGTGTADPALAQPLTQRIQVGAATAPAPTVIQFRIRPYANFDDNFLFSEDGGPEDTLGTGGAPAQNQTPGADYPYTYSYVGGSLAGDYVALDVDAGEITAALAAASNPAANSLVTLNAVGGTTGTFSFRYTVGSSSVEHTVEVEVRGSLPYTGLHDDTSFAFDYTGPGWTPVYSEPNINNTLHRTAALGDRADFSFVGTGFALYMQGSSAGGWWELQVDGQPLVWNGKQMAARGNLTCRTSSTTGTKTSTTDFSKFISGRGTTAYVVSCSRLRPGESHTVSVINREARQLNVDAIGILTDSTVLLPGTHYVNESQVLPLFFGWTLFSDRNAANGSAVSTTNTNIADVQFSFKGSGLAIGTTLEQNNTTKQGAQYRICVAPEATPANRVCQNFNNATGAGTSPVWGVFRPFFGFDPSVERLATIEILSIPAGARLVFDSIVVLDATPTAALPFGTTEDDVRGPIIALGGRDGSWLLETNNASASNGSLTSIARGINNAGPFLSFRVPAAADTINWFRQPATTQSQQMLICVNRARGDAAGDQAKHCILRDLRAANTNPLIIRQSDFAGATWGPAWRWAGESVDTHFVEIFSLVNQPFNLDSIQVINSAQPFDPSYYEQNVAGLQYFDQAYNLVTPYPGSTVCPTTAVTPPAFCEPRANTRYSNSTQINANKALSGVAFRFTGTGFAPSFTLDAASGPVKVCWLRDSGAPPTQIDSALIQSVVNTGRCLTFDNYSRSIIYRAPRSILGLQPGTYTAVVQHAGADRVYNAALRRYEGQTMQFDALEVFGANWGSLAPVTLQTPSVRVETSFTNRLADNRFQYFGAGWRSFTGTAARSYSGQNYDQVRTVGASVVLRTNGGDVLRIYRDVRAGYAPLQVCWMPEDDFDPFQCAILRNDGGTGVSAPFQVQLSSSGAHVVSITALTNGTFNLDAVELLSSAQPLTAGLYPESDPRLIYTPVADAANGWRDVFVTSYLDRSAYQTTAANAQVRFRFTGTGFSLFTLFEPAAGSLIIEVDGVATGDDYQVVNTTSANTRVYYGMAHSITGLPFDTYTVTIRQPDAKRFTVDGVEIYGDYPAAAAPLGTFDDTAADASGQPYLRFGPGNAAWATRSGSAAGAYLNQTHRFTNRIGAQLNFAVDNANAVTLHHSGSTTTSVQVCASLMIAPYTRTCLPPQSLAANKNTTFVFNPTTPGDYYVSVTNLVAGVNFYVDAVGVHDTSGAGALKAGVYQENHPQLAPRFGAGWLPAAASAGATDGLARATNSASGSQTLDFTFIGTGFSIVLAESTTTSPQYSLCVEVASNPGSCDTVPLTTLTNAATSTARAPLALTYVGFSPGTYTVRLANADPGPAFTRPLVVDRVDILNGVPEQIGSAITGNVENTDRRIVYFPYFSFNEVLAAAASGGSQHLGSMRGSVAYFELNGFTGTNIEYVRQTLAAYGLVNVCSAAIGTNSAGCTPAVINNAAAPLGFRQSALPSPAVGAGTRWVFLRNADGKPMPVDFVRPAFTTTPALTAGFYEDNHPGLNFSNGTFTSAPVSGASGGTVRLTTTVNDALLFEFTGTGFAAFFTFDPKADAVRICWRAGLGWTVAQTQDTANGAVCRTYDNESSAIRYQAARTVAGLPLGDYTASVQMLPDNNLPLPHTPANTPITMQIDAVQIVNDALPANVLNTPAQRYETSFANRTADARFLYYGNGWRTVSGTAARAYSGQNYDTISSVIGAGVVFRTNNANAIILYRDMRPGLAPLEVCAAPAALPTRWFCTPITSTATTSNQQPVRVFLNDPSVPGSGPGQADDTAPHIVSIMTVGAGPVFLDAVEVVNTTQALPPGLYEDVHPALGYDADWVEVFSTSYSDRRARQTNVLNAQMTFQITGATGFEVGMVQDVFGGDVEVCYADNAAFTGQACYTYTNQATRASFLSSRVVAGLTTGNYWVRVRNVDDGVPPRDPRYTPARLVVDYVRVLGEALPPIVTQPGLYNEDARDGSGQPYLGLVPVERWSAFTGTAARGYSASSYVGVVDNARRISSTYAGPAAALRLQVPAGGATVILYTGPAASTNTLQLLVCANQVAGPSTPDCTIITNLNTANQIVLNSANLPALGNTTADLRLTFRALTPGFFRIDGFQIVHGTTLTPGIYDDFLVANGGLLDSTGPAAWVGGQKNARAYGGTQVRSPLSTAGRGAQLAFTFDGTGFSLLTQVATTGVDFRVCYRRAAGGGAFPTHSNPLNQDGSLQAGDVICRTLTTNTTTADWTARNAGRIRPASANQYGFAFYGLPEDEYRVEVVHVDGTVTTSSALFVDGVVVFGQAPTTQRLEPGQLYDDVASQIVYAPDAFWTAGTARFGPARGPWQKTEHTAINAGALAQLAVNGNALVVYQTASAANSRSVWLCLVTPQGLECTDYSQAAATTYFTPVAFYGFGPSTPTNPHQVIIENRDAGKKLSLDALQVLR